MIPAPSGRDSDLSLLGNPHNHASTALHRWSLELCVPTTKQHASTRLMPHLAAHQRARETDKPGGGGSALLQRHGAILQAPYQAPHSAAAHAAEDLHLYYVYTAEGSSTGSAPAFSAGQPTSASTA